MQKAAAFLFLFAALLLGAPLVHAQDGAGVKGQLKSIEEKLADERQMARALKAQSDKLKRQETKLRAESILAAKSAQRHENDLSEVEETLLALKEAEAEKLKTLGQSREQFVGVLGALERLARNPPEALVAQPMSTSDLVRSAILLRSAVPEIENKAKALKKELASLAETRDAVADRRKELAALTTKLDGERKRLSSLISKKKALRLKKTAQQQKAAARLKDLTGKAKDLRDLFQKLEENRKREERRQAAEAKAKAEAEAKREKDTVAKKESGSLEVAALPNPTGGAPITKAKGHLWRPVSGRVIDSFGGKLDTGLTRKGINIRARRNGQVVAPYDGRVVYAGIFRGYGQLLIIEHGEGYHSLISGMARIDSVVGQWLLAGEPVGVMSGKKTGKPTLYLEMRKDGQPINPQPWLVASN